MVRQIPGPEQHFAGRQAGPGHGPDRTLGLRQDHAPALLQPHQRALRQRHHDRPNHGAGQEHLRRRRLAQRAAQVGGHGLPAAQSAADLDPRERALRRPRPRRPAERYSRGRAGRHGRNGPPRRAALGRGEGPAEAEGDPALARAAAEAVHRPLAAAEAAGDPHGRALLGAGRRGRRADRGPDRPPAQAATRSSS